ncbi:MAG: hypothetical protein ABSA93_21615 [Streptosporangiaceae bacterium]|jgi:hypothetical protein
MNALINVARYHLVNRVNYLAIPWLWLGFAFVADLVIFAMIPVSHHLVPTAHGIVQVQNTSGRYAGGLAAIVLIFLVLGVQSVSKSLPFALALGVSRRTYYTGTALLAVTLAVGYGLVLTAAQAIERATNGWGLSTHIFRVPYILNGPWYLTWLTTSVVLALLFVYGMWIGIIYKRWNLIGVLTFVAAEVIVLLVPALLISWSHSWAGIGHFFTALSAAGLTGVLAALAAALLAGGYATIRRVTI